VTIGDIRRLFLLAAAILFSSCSFFQRPPPLPRHAAIESGGSEEEFARLVGGADIIYFPSEAATFASRSDPAWKLLAALRSGGDPFAIGWDWSGNEPDRRDFVSEAGKPGAHVLVLNDADKLVADKIASYFREHRNDKILVFIRRERLGLGQGVPFLVAQQTKARQLILNPRKSRGSGARLLARN
jgi:hypothetical protein